MHWGSFADFYGFEEKEKSYGLSYQGVTKLCIVVDRGG